MAILGLLQLCNASMVISRRLAVRHGGTHSALLRSALLPSPASSLSRELVSGRHFPLSERALKKSSEYSSLYDVVVPKDNKLRLINELVDF